MQYTKTLVVILALGFMGPSALFAASPSSVNLGSAGNFVILAKTGVSSTGVTSVLGDIGVSPAQATYITGFGLILPTAGAFSTSALVTGKIYAPDYANPTPANLTTAVLDMQTAYTDAAGRAADVTELGAGNIGGLTLVPGVYKWGTGLIIPTDVTLSGSANDVWIFIIAQNLNISSATHITLAGGAKANNVFWVVAGQTTIGTTAVFNGNILDQTAIVLNTGATLNGRALAQAAVTLDSNAVTIQNSATPATPATPATSATPAVPGVSSATPAVPATPSTYNGNSSNTNSSSGNSSVNHSNTSNQGYFSPTKSIFGQEVKALRTDLKKGAKNNDVKTLQQFLISHDNGPATDALAKVGATTYFGELTRKALAEFQARVGIKPALGYFGPVTMAYITKN